ncbi:MAG: hypothetical protein IIB00_01560 [candidate division Zixibacteria bacterium]|nr:hypothetical protein [candidate division Zixibacteria bacterium]
MSEETEDTKPSADILSKAGKSLGSSAVSHEKLGEVILTSENSEIGKVLLTYDQDPKEISRIIASEARENPFYTQLMSSTLDCDRFDYLLRDSKMAGVSYGLVDLEYILQNLRWHEHEKRVCFHEKAIHALEHFITARFYHYNIIHHKAVMGFELMAKALFYAMMKWPKFDPKIPYEIVRTFDDITEKVKNDASFLANFTDEYFWFYLDRWIPYDDFCGRLRESLLNRDPLHLIAEERVLYSDSQEPNLAKYNYFKKTLLTDPKFEKILKCEDVAIESLTITERKIKFEEIPSTLEYSEVDRVHDEDLLKLVKIFRGQDRKLDDLIGEKSSIIHLLSKYETRLVRVYGLVEKKKRKTIDIAASELASEFANY